MQREQKKLKLVAPKRKERYFRLARGNPLYRRGFRVDKVAGYAPGVGKAPATRSEAKGAEHVGGGAGGASEARERRADDRRDYSFRRDKDERCEIGARAEREKKREKRGREREGEKRRERERKRERDREGR